MAFMAPVFVAMGMSATTAATVATVASVASTAFTVIGALEQGRAAQSASNYNAQLAQQNAVLARRKAAEDERRFRRTSRRQLGATRAAYAAAGVTLEGTPSDIMDDATYVAELDALTIREGGQQSASAFEAETRLEKLRGSSAKQGAILGAASSLLS